METLLTIFILVLIFIFTFAAVLCLYAVFCRIEQRRAYNELQQNEVTADEVCEQSTAAQFAGRTIAKGIPATKGTFMSICEIENMARGYLEKEPTTGMYLVVMRLTSLRRTLEMQVKMNEQNTPKK